MNKRIIILLFIILHWVFISHAQDEEEYFDDPLIPVIENPELKIQIYEGYYWAVIEGDTVKVIQMRPFYVYNELPKFKNKKQEKFYRKTVRDVKKTLPYAKLIYEILVETYQYMETLPDDEARQKHIEKMEDELFKQYKPILKKFTYSQGKMLIKLVNRECNQSSYEIIRAFLGSFRAGFWQTFGKLFGVTLKAEWDPEGKDKDIERICVLVEQGML
ncbi:MAG: DUF4294 domain-containing protein [Bacteroidaceae bacterium]|nr:DUF4294 domain-containing protein [Bacteroidaceae bacterium]